MPPPATASHSLSKARPPPSAPSPRSRSRKSSTPLASQKISTTLSAHPRTDPINALTVLVKLLSSLPSRIGGCQYKFSQAEHALSLHLISILDPFVHHGVRALTPTPSSSALSAPLFGFAHQPTEIIDAILFHVDSRKDLLSVALGCKRLHDIVFPRHFDYRVIRCKLSSISVWNHLIHHKSLARNVRKLEIIDERSPSAGNADGKLVPRGILQSETDLESTDDELSMHAKQERFLSAALVRMTGLMEFKWSCNHSPISIAHVWPTLMMRAANLKLINICDNLVFAPKINGDEEEENYSGSEPEDGQASHQARGLMSRVPTMPLLNMQSVIFRSTSHSYGAAKQPELARISAMLHQCANLKDLEITYIAARSPGAAGVQGTVSRTRPLADEFLLYGRWGNLTTITLTNLRCGSSVALSSFLSAHPMLEVLHMDINIHSANASSPLHLADAALPRLREIKASRDIINTILECPSDIRRPLEAIKGFKLSGTASSPSQTQNTPSRSVSDITFLANLKPYASGIRKIELVGWHDMEDVRKLTSCTSNVQHLDIGRRLGAAGQRNPGSDKIGPATNMVEWAELLATLPELVTMHGVRFFYEVSSAAIGGPLVVSANASNLSWSGTAQAQASVSVTRELNTATNVKSQAHMSMMERSRMRKNDEIAGVLAWKCRKLRRLDHWEERTGKVVVLVRDHGHGDDVGKDRENKVRWEVRRLKHL